MLKQIWQLIAKKKASEKAYKTYRKNGQSPFLRKLGAESLRDRKQELKKEYKRITNQN